MSDAVEVQIADAIVAELNDGARSWQTPTVQFTAERGWLPVYKPADLDALRVMAVPTEIDQEEKKSRGVELMQYKLPVDFQKLVSFVSEQPVKADLDALTKLAQDVHDFYRDGHRLATYSQGKVMTATRPFIYDLDRLNEEHVFETYLELSVWVLR